LFHRSLHDALPIYSRKHFMRVCSGETERYPGGRLVNGQCKRFYIATHRFEVEIMDHTDDLHRFYTVQVGRSVGMGAGEHAYLLTYCIITESKLLHCSLI